jgi:hypothetical protein
MANSQARIVGEEGRRAIARVERRHFGDVQVPIQSPAISRATDTAVDIYVSPALRLGIERAHPMLANPTLLAAGSLIATSRRQYVWDVDVAIAAGAQPTPEGVRAWRFANRVPVPRAEWPTNWVPDMAAVGMARRLVGAVPNPAAMRRRG